MIRVVTYYLYNGRSPFDEWVEDLDYSARSAILSRLTRIPLGNFGDCKSIQGVSGLWELRINYGPGFRVYFGKHGLDVIVLLVGGDKGSQQRDITRAKKYWANYQENL